MTFPVGEGHHPLSVDKFEEAVRLVETFITKIRTKFDELIRLINQFVQSAWDELARSVFSRFIELFTHNVREGLEKIRRHVEEVRSHVTQLLDHAQASIAGSVPVASLFTRAYDLVHKVNRPLTGLHGEMAGSGEIDFWRGPAKETYEKRVATQQQAVLSASEKVEALATFLGAAAAANTAYMARLAERLGQVYGAVVTAFVDVGAIGVGAITQLMDLLAHFSETIGTAVAEVVGYIATLGARVSEVLAQILALETTRSDLTGLTRDGHWPAPVSA